MAAAPHSHRRVGARHRAKLKKWSDKVAREEAGRAEPSAERPAAARKRRLEAARKKLRKLFH